MFEVEYLWKGWIKKDEVNADLIRFAKFKIPPVILSKVLVQVEIKVQV